MRLSGCLYVDDHPPSKDAITLCKHLERLGLMKCEIVHVNPDQNTLRKQLEARLGFGLFLPLLELPTLGDYSGYDTIKAYFESILLNDSEHASSVGH